jgi:hypothetical protein
MQQPPGIPKPGWIFFYAVTESLVPEIEQGGVIPRLLSSHSTFDPLAEPPYFAP